MSAMHWEARRRQSALDRRKAHSKKQLENGSSDTCSPSEAKAPQEQTDGNQCPHCNGVLPTPVNHTAKVPNRYSSLQYTQQW